MWGIRVYIINGRVTRKKLDDRSHHGYFMRYSATTGVILYWKPNQYFLSTYTIMFGLMNIIFFSPQKTSTSQVIYYLNKILKFLFVIHTPSTWFRVNLILHPIHSSIQQFSHMKFSYLLLEINLALIYFMMKILKYPMSLIKSQIHQPVINFQHRLNEMCGPLLSMDKNLSHLNARLMNSIVIKTNVVNPSSISVYVEGRARKLRIQFGPRLES